jgi:hypothetical protein
MGPLNADEELMVLALVMRHGVIETQPVPNGGGWWIRCGPFGTYIWAETRYEAIFRAYCGL